MVMRADILEQALLTCFAQENIDAASYDRDRYSVLVTSASGSQYTQSQALHFSHYRALFIVCGHYEGIDQRFIDAYAKQILIPQGKGLALVVLSEGEFHGELIDPAGRTIKRYEPTRANSSGPYALFIPFHFGRDSKENSLVLVTSTGNRQELRFRRGE
jgi:tRNA (guanine-N1)-methyltransferase